jgi:CheY-like chemotaxis protein
MKDNDNSKSCHQKIISNNIEIMKQYFSYSFSFNIFFLLSIVFSLMFFNLDVARQEFFISMLVNSSILLFFTKLSKLHLTENWQKLNSLSFIVYDLLYFLFQANSVNPYLVFFIIYQIFDNNFQTLESNFIEKYFTFYHIFPKVFISFVLNIYLVLLDSQLMSLNTYFNILYINICFSLQFYFILKIIKENIKKVKLLIEKSNNSEKIKFTLDQFDNFPTGILLFKIGLEDMKIQLEYCNIPAENLLMIKVSMSPEEIKEKLSIYEKQNEKSSRKKMTFYNFYSDLTKSCSILDGSVQNSFPKSEKYKNGERTIIVKFSEFFSKENQQYYRMLCVENLSDERKQIQKNIYKTIKSQFILTISHELNNPLNGLLFSCEKLIDSQKDSREKTDKLIEKIKRFKFYIKFFIKNLTLSFKIILREKLKSNPSNLNLYLITNATLEKFKPFFDSKKITYTSDLKNCMNVVLYFDYEYFKFFLKNIFMYIAYKVDNTGKFIINSYILTEKNVVRIEFRKYVNTFNVIRENLMSVGSDKAVDFSEEVSIDNTVQTKEMLHEIIINLSLYLNIQVTFQEEQKSYLSIEMPYKEIESPGNESSDIVEFSPQTKGKTKTNIEQLSRSLNVPHNIEDEQSKKLLENIAAIFSGKYKMRTKKKFSKTTLTSSKEQLSLFRNNLLNTVKQSEENWFLLTNGEKEQFNLNSNNSVHGNISNDENALEKIRNFTSSFKQNTKNSEFRAPTINRTGRGFSLEIPKITITDALLDKQAPALNESITKPFQSKVRSNKLDINKHINHSETICDMEEAGNLQTANDFILNNSPPVDKTNYNDFPVAEEVKEHCTKASPSLFSKKVPFKISTIYPQNNNSNILSKLENGSFGSTPNIININNKMINDTPARENTELSFINNPMSNKLQPIHQQQNVFNFNIDVNLSDIHREEVSHFEFEDNFILDPSDYFRCHSNVDNDPMKMVRNFRKGKSSRKIFYAEDYNLNSNNIGMNYIPGSAKTQLAYSAQVKTAVSLNNLQKTLLTPELNKRLVKKNTMHSFGLRKLKKPKTVGQNNHPTINPTLTPNFHPSQPVICDCHKILIVDDEQFNINTLKFILKNFKIATDFCLNGREALEKINRNTIKTCCTTQYKLIFMDVMMPVMDGIEASNKIQEMYDKNFIKACNIVIISAHDIEEISDRVKNIKLVREFVAKPVKKTKIEDLLNKYFFDIN